MGFKKGKSQRLWDEAKKIMPGGCQLLSKRAEMFLPDQWPAYYSKARGISVTDLDGKTYLDFSYMGIGACVLGYADPDVNRAVRKVVDDGSMSTLNAPEEVELAKELIKLNPWAKMVRFARTGGEAVAIAVRIGRAHSGKDKVAFCGYHGWHDWYLASNLASDKNLDGHLLSGLAPSGVPRGLLGSALPFRYNHIEELEEIIANNDIGVIVMEPIRHQEPADGFLKKVRAIATKHKIVLIIDEVSVGFRIRLGGAYASYGIEPDIAVYAKALGNGYPIAAVVGRAEVMDAAQKTFISSTYWTERIGPAAALAVIKKMRAKKVPQHLDNIGAEIIKGWKRLAKKHGINIKTETPNCLCTFSFDYPNAQEIRTLFTQEMLDRGFLAVGSVYVSYAHTSAHVKKYLKAVDEVFALLRAAIDEGDVVSKLRGPVAQTGFKRLT
jgi:glutamate-1-semialdehyde 2,1-aminomutase